METQEGESRKFLFMFLMWSCAFYCYSCRVGKFPSIRVGFPTLTVTAWRLIGAFQSLDSLQQWSHTNIILGMEKMAEFSDSDLGLSGLSRVLLSFVVTTEPEPH